MTHFSAKTFALTAFIALGSLMSTTAHAAIVRSSNGMPVLTKEGNCVISGWEGEQDCAAAKAAAGMGTAETKTEHDQEKTVYFEFNKSTLNAHAKRRLDHLAAKLKAEHKHGAPVVAIAGFADRIGNASYNEKLALKRAQAVRAYLVSKGIKAKKIAVRSFGKTEPKADCPADMPRAKLINCLREDRRVEIEVTETK